MILDRLHFNKDTTRELMRIALPMVVSQGTFAVMIFTDRYFMSQIDPTHMSAALGGGVSAASCGGATSCAGAAAGAVALSRGQDTAGH